ncbi:hypothetical protein RNZ50_00345 [Paracoccaceae bacterium Fryx2]|nr:hypothetical protein [Paracoccaceae bacterium Fryx2]
MFERGPGGEHPRHAVDHDDVEAVTRKLQDPRGIALEACVDLAAAQGLRAAFGVDDLRGRGQQAGSLHPRRGRVFATGEQRRIGGKARPDPLDEGRVMVDRHHAAHALCPPQRRVAAAVFEHRQAGADFLFQKADGGVGEPRQRLAVLLRQLGRGAFQPTRPGQIRAAQRGFHVGDGLPFIVERQA